LSAHLSLREFGQIILVTGKVAVLSDDLDGAFIRAITVDVAKNSPHYMVKCRSKNIFNKSSTLRFDSPSIL